MTELNKAIIHIITACGMTDAALSKRTGIPEVSLCKYRHGETCPSFERAVLLLSAAYKARPQNIPERAKYKSIGDMLYGGDTQ